MNYFKSKIFPPKIMSKSEMIHYLVWLEKRSIIITYPFNFLAVLKALTERSYTLFIIQFAYLALVTVIYFLFKKYNERYYSFLTFCYFLIGLLSLNLIVNVAPIKAISMLIWIPGLWMALFYFIDNLRIPKLASISLILLTFFSSFNVVMKIPNNLTQIIDSQIKADIFFSLLICMFWMAFFLKSRSLVQDYLFQKLEEEKELAVTLNRVVSHDLANSLQLLTFSIENIKKRPEKTNSYLDKAIFASTQMKDIISNIKNITLIGTMKGNQQFDKQNLKTLIDDVIFFLSDNIRQKNIELIFNEPEEIFCIEHINPIILKYNIFANLISNAIKFTPKNGKILIEINYFNSNTVCISIIDSGIGIPENLLKVKRGNL